MIQMSIKTLTLTYMRKYRLTDLNRCLANFINNNNTHLHHHLIDPSIIYSSLSSFKFLHNIYKITIFFILSVCVWMCVCVCKFLLEYSSSVCMFVKLKKKMKILIMNSCNQQLKNHLLLMIEIKVVKHQYDHHLHLLLQEKIMMIIMMV